jgi:hypothetical protein
MSTLAIRFALFLSLLPAGQLLADDPAPQPGAVDPKLTADDKELPGLKRITKDYDVWIDQKRKLVVVDGKICLREGQLEMFACPRSTKEHESVIAVNAKSMHVHTALLLVGAKEGTPVKFDPKYVAATGPEVEILVLWKDKDGKPKKVRAQEMIINVKTGKPMAYNWVFAGSAFFVDEETGKQHYLAEGGELVCVSNFPTATLDLSVRSTDANADLLFKCNTELIPPLGTPVRMVLIPKLPAEKPAEKAPGK